MDRSNRTLVIGRIVMTVNSTGNDTDNPIVTKQNSNFYVSVDIASLIGVLLTNGFIVALLLFNRHLHTPFNIYVISLLISNILCYDVFVNVLQILSDWYMSWWLGPSACIVLLYGNFVFTGGTNMSHFLITLNRLWAVLYPFSYRQYHSKTVAILVCLSMWTFIHVMTLPPLIMEAIRLKLDGDGCSLDNASNHAWVIVSLCFIYHVPTLFLVGSYPIFLYKKVRMGLERRDITPSISVKIQSTSRTKRMELDRGFVVLTAMTVSVIICWLPNNISATVILFTGNFPPDWVRKLFWALYPVQAVIDPVLFAVCLQDVRLAVKKFVKDHCYRCRSVRDGTKVKGTY